jgi:hypothetical protein
MGSRRTSRAGRTPSRSRGFRRRSGPRARSRGGRRRRGGEHRRPRLRGPCGQSPWESADPGAARGNPGRPPPPPFEGRIGKERETAGVRRRRRAHSPASKVGRRARRRRALCRGGAPARGFSRLLPRGPRDRPRALFAFRAVARRGGSTPAAREGRFYDSAAPRRGPPSADSANVRKVPLAQGGSPCGKRKTAWASGRSRRRRTGARKRPEPSRTIRSPGRERTPRW